MVRNRADGPSTCRAAIAVASLLVDAGANPALAFLAYSTCPVDRLVTSTPSAEPNDDELTTGLSALATPPAVAAAEAAALRRRRPAPGRVPPAGRP